MSNETGGHLLVVDDDDRIRTLLHRYLTAQGHSVMMARDAAQARKLVDIYEFDLIVLDIMMPGEDGLSLTRSLREERQTPILLLTARGEARDRIDGLSAGADDYLAKPFEPEELALRIASILKRTRPVAPLDSLSFGDCLWDISRSELRRDGVLVRLTDAERRMMEVFASRPGDTFSREEMARKLGVTADRSIDVQITRLRRKLEDDAGEPLYLKTMRGQGYRLMPDL